MNKLTIVRSIQLSAIVLFCFSSILSQGSGQPGRSTVSGMVSDAQRNPIQFVPVELMNEFNSVIQRTKTDGSGRYFFRALNSGRYAVRVLPLGTNFEEQTQETEISGVGFDGRLLADNVQLDFRLVPRRSSRDVIEVKGVIFAQDVPPNARKLYEAAIDDLDNAKVAEAVTGLENAILAFPTYYLALVRVGLVYVDQQKFEIAKTTFTKAIEVNPRSFAGWYGLSYANYSLNDTELAVTAAEKALELDKSSVNALFLMGMSQRRLKNYDSAEKSLLQAKKLDNGKTPDISWNLALLYAHNLKRFNDAANELEIYLTINPDVPNKESIKKLIKQFRENTPPSS